MAFFGADVLSGATSRLTSDYGAAAAGAFRDGAERQSTSSLDELVQRNIQDVLTRVGQDDQLDQDAGFEPRPPSSRAALSLQQTYARPPSSSNVLTYGTSSSGAATLSATGRASQAGVPTSSSIGGDGGSGVARPVSASKGAATTSQPRTSLCSGGGSASGGISVGMGGGAGVSSSAIAAALDVPGNLEASLRLHKARIQGLEDELQRVTKLAQGKDSTLSEAQKEAKTLRADKVALAKENKALQTLVDQLRRTATDAEAALAAKEAAVKEASREGGRADKARAAVEAEVRARDVRLTRALEEVARYKALLQDVQGQEREVKDVAKSEYARVVAENKKLERQRAELLVAFRKQLKLVDVLKRQRVHLEASRALAFTEEEFVKLLNLGAS